MAKDDLLPNKKTSSPKGSSSSGRSSPAARMVRSMRVTRAAGILLGGFVTLVGIMSLVGLVSEIFWVRLVIALLVVVGLPAFISDRFLKRTNLGGDLGTVADIFAIVLLGIALIIVAVDVASKPLLVREGDRYARSGSRVTARIVYFLGGVSPVFPEEKAAAPASASAGATGSASAGATGSASAGAAGSPATSAGR